MKITIYSLILFATLISCNRNNYVLEDYIDKNETFNGNNFVTVAAGFSILLPSDFIINEESEISDSLLYLLEASPDSMEQIGIQGLIIYKGTIINGTSSGYFDMLLGKSINNFSNIKLLEKTTLKLNNLDAQVANLVYTNNGEVIQKEIDVFIPYNQQEYYFISIICDNNAHADKAIIKMFDCVESFKIIY